MAHRDAIRHRVGHLLFPDDQQHFRQGYREQLATMNVQRLRQVRAV